MPDTARADHLRDQVTAAIGGQYLIDREVGRGGMAVVYAAEDVRLQRPVALKVLPPELAFRAEVRERFVREAQTAARLNHPHIVPIYAVHEEGGLVCFAMALVTGESLAARLLREPRPPFMDVASILEQTADALAYAHACGVVHRDVKPDNILTDRESGRMLVTDFGIARAAEGGERLTQTGVAVGTPSFMSPEQATGDRDVDGRSDLYALGVLGYLMVTGRLPFEATSTPAMLLKHVSETPPPIRALRPDAPHVLVEIIERSLAKRPQDRWDNALAMRDALRRAQRDGSLTPEMGAAAPVVAPVMALAPSLMPGEKPGHRAEHWAPRHVPVPELSPRYAGYALSSAAPSSAAAPYPGSLSSAVPTALRRSDQEVIDAFKAKLLRHAVLIGFLGVINAVTSPQFPWVVFPAFGLSMGTLARYSRLRARGITWDRLWGSAKDVGLVDAATSPAQVTQAVAGFRRHLKFLAGATGAALASFAIGTTFNLDPMVVPFVGGLLAGLVSMQMLTVDFFRLRRLGLTPADALSPRWKQIAQAADRRTHADKRHELLARIAGPTVLASSFGDTVRNAADDRVVIEEITSKLTDTDRFMVPDVEPTADALLERISALASGLERLDRDLPGDALPQLQARIQQLRAEADTSPDSERRLSLLTRQRTSLEELVARRDTMLRQLDSASMALRSLRFDIMKLRTMGMGDAMHDITNATQEARALSRDLERVAEAVDEMRKL